MLQLKIVPFTRGSIALRRRNGDEKVNPEILITLPVVSLIATFDSEGDAAGALNVSRTELRRKFKVLRIPDEFNPNEEGCILFKFE